MSLKKTVEINTFVSEKRYVLDAMAYYAISECSIQRFNNNDKGYNDCEYILNKDSIKAMIHQRNENSRLGLIEPVHEQKCNGATLPRPPDTSFSETLFSN